MMRLVLPNKNKHQCVRCFPVPGQFSAPGIPSLSFFYHRPSHRSSVQQAGGSDGRGDGVRVAVGGGPAVLEVALLLLAHLARDADAGAAVGHAGRELVDAGGLQVAQQAALVVLAAVGVVHGDVLGVSLPQLLDGSLNVPGGEDKLSNGGISHRTACRCWSLKTAMFHSEHLHAAVELL